MSLIIPGMKIINQIVYLKNFRNIFVQDCGIQGASEKAFSSN